MVTAPTAASRSPRNLLLLKQLIARSHSPAEIARLWQELAALAAREARNGIRDQKCQEENDPNQL
jgi:hypothetical protein